MKKVEVELELTKEWREIFEYYCKKHNITLSQLAARAMKWWMTQEEEETKK